MPETPSVKTGPLYREGRERITQLVRANAGRADEKVPHCPEWSIKELLAHLSGICVDILAGRVEGVATEPWTRAQVDARRDWPVGKILDEWTEASPRVEEIAHLFPNGVDVQWLTDLTTHEHDIRTALDEPGFRDADVVGIGLTWLVGAMAGMFTPAFRVATPEGDELVVGSGDPQTAVRASRFDMLRALTGRRSEDQIAAFDWDGDYKPYLGAFSLGPFTMATSSVPE